MFPSTTRALALLAAFGLAAPGLVRATTPSPTCGCSHDSTPTYAPVPASASGPALGPGNWRVEPFGGGAYMATDNQYQALFLVSTKGVIVVDAPPTMGRGLLYAIGNTTRVPVTHLVYSHSHTDHIGAAFLFPKSVTIVAHRETREIIKLTPDPNRPLPEVVFDDELKLKVGNQTLLLSYKGLNHQVGNIFIYAPKQKVLMLVDIVYPGWMPFSELGRTQFVPGYVRAFDQVLEYDFDHFVAGHLTRSGNRADVVQGREYVLDLKANCARAIELSGLPPNATNPVSVQEVIPPVAAANPGNPWAVFKAVLDRTSEYCANVTNEKWLGVIGAADVYGFENAYVMVESLRIDWDVLGPFGVAP